MSETEFHRLPQERSIRGLATLSLLKTYYDAGRDHIGMFEPLLTDVLAAMEPDDFSAEDVRASFSDRHGLTIPIPTLKSMLSRQRRRGTVQREGGRYFRIPAAVQHVNVQEAKARIQEEQLALAGALRSFAEQRGVPIADDGEALLILLAFLGEHQLPMLFQDPAGLCICPKSRLPARQEKMVARFVLDHCLTDPRLGKYIHAMMEGYVLQNALLLQDISVAARRFQDLTVYFDTGLLLGALGLEGEGRAREIREVVDLLKTAGARLAVFSRTIEEMRNILRVYERALATQTGRRSLHATELTRYFLTNHYNPSDVRQVSALLEKDIRRLGIDVKPPPAHETRFTFDERGLGERLARPDETGSEPRIVHDVDCVAGILTLRKGGTPDTFDRAKAVFATSSGTVVRAVVEWFKEGGQGGVPPIVHYLAIANIAWLKNPASATELRQHELVALCQAALRPSRKLWSCFLEHLRQLQQNGAITSEEEVAIVASEMTDQRLGEVEEQLDEIDARSLTEVVERVKASYREVAEKEVALAESRSSDEVEGRRQTTLRVVSRVRQIAAILSCSVFYGIAVLVAGALLLLLPGVLGRFGSWGSLLGVVAALVVGVLSFLSVAYGTNLRALQERLETRIRSHLIAWLLGDQATQTDPHEC